MAPPLTRRHFTTGLGMALAGAPLAACGAATAADDAERTLRLGMVAAEGSVQHRSAQLFAQEVIRATEGRLYVDVFPSGQLGSDETLGQSLAMGGLDLAFINQGSMAGLDPMLDFHYLPYIVTDYDEADRIFFGDGLIPRLMTETLASHDIRALGWYELEFRGVSTRDGLARSPEQLAGKKIRVPGSAAIGAFFEAAGAVAVTVSMPELYSALQQGTVDGQDNGMIITYDNRLHETNPFYTRTKHVYATGTIGMSEKVWPSLSSSDQDALLAAARTAQDWEVRAERELTEEYVANLRDDGAEVVELTDAELSEYRELGLAIWDDMTSIYGEGNIAALRDEVAAL
ncbi:TRAP transporter substrate-binding protein [Brachybacterium sacelli]|uniref:Tripartite ATP-independent transporter DctP family solute receptor n=1 Tax=Brachybacterium sacelli TaxID=173364 RepID=A0ABS4X1C6_9MICO|nr:TRAP transporter substrate-binding protein [Brachybacterium sacelli]MBP2381534.1 tripartite ATP-independent transporter DctP family solute receptor [Brachybacterium sacelli]